MSENKTRKGNEKDDGNRRGNRRNNKLKPKKVCPTCGPDAGVRYDKACRPRAFCTMCGKKITTISYQE